MGFETRKTSSDSLSLDSLSLSLSLSQYIEVLHSLLLFLLFDSRVTSEEKPACEGLKNHTTTLNECTQRQRRLEKRSGEKREKRRERFITASTSSPLTNFV